MDVSVCRGEVGGEGEVVYFVEDLGGVLLVLAVDRKEGAYVYGEVVEVRHGALRDGREGMKEGEGEDQDKMKASITYLGLHPRGRKAASGGDLFHYTSLFSSILPANHHASTETPRKEAPQESRLSRRESRIASLRSE